MNENAKTIQVSVKLTVTVDLEDYRLNYGDESIPQIRQDIRQAFVDGGHAVLANGILDVELLNR